MELESDPSVTPLNSILINIDDDDDDDDTTTTNNNNLHSLHTSQVYHPSPFPMTSENELMRNRAMAIMIVLRNLLEEAEMGDLSILLVNEYSIPIDVLHGMSVIMIMIMIMIDLYLMDR